MPSIFGGHFVFIISHKGGQFLVQNFIYFFRMKPFFAAISTMIIVIQTPLPFEVLAVSNRAAGFITTIL